jgi:hypothetical protein
MEALGHTGPVTGTLYLYLLINIHCYWIWGWLNPRTRVNVMMVKNRTSKFLSVVIRNIVYIYIVSV